MGGRHARFTAVLGLALGLLITADPAHAQSKPNIIVIMGDDVGWFNIGAYHQGMTAGRTPNLDKLAAEGMRFTDYYIGQYAQTFIDFPPMQKGASFNMEQVKEELQKKMKRPRALPSDEL
jgi:Sulfatase